jgi:phosphoribosylanthranilate isomerase
VVLDAHVEGVLGGTGRTLDWQGVAAATADLRGRGAMLVLAGGLRAQNVGAAIRMLAPDVVDVSSGVEQAPGIKDHQQMHAFADAVREAALEPRG